MAKKVGRRPADDDADGDERDLEAEGAAKDPTTRAILKALGKLSKDTETMRAEMGELRKIREQPPVQPREDVEDEPVYDRRGGLNPLVAMGIPKQLVPMIVEAYPDFTMEELAQNARIIWPMLRIVAGSLVPTVNQRFRDFEGRLEDVTASDDPDMPHYKLVRKTVADLKKQAKERGSELDTRTAYLAACAIDAAKLKEHEEQRGERSGERTTPVRSRAAAASADGTRSVRQHQQDADDFDRLTAADIEGMDDKDLDAYFEHVGGREF